MKIVFFAHPSFIPSQSMPRYASWIAEGMKSKGHIVEIWQPWPKCYNWKAPVSIKKWLGYIDQYVLFPTETREKLKNQPSDTLFVFTDHALGPWVPLAANRPHIVHCHDFLAQSSAMGRIPENRVGWTGKRYQEYIRNGYRKARNFISVSEQTRKDLHTFLDFTPMFSEVVYNGLTQTFTPLSQPGLLRRELSQEIDLDLSKGYLLHVGGNQWYKNRKGVIEIYNAWREQSSFNLPLLMVGATPTEKLKEVKEGSSFEADIHFLTGIADTMLKKIYAAASLFLFPSLAEGFGWPIIEAMASGCLVITTAEAPMTEVGGEAVFYIDKRPVEGERQWAAASALVIERVLSISENERNSRIQFGFKNVERFDPSAALNKIEQLYIKVMEEKKA